MECPNCQSQNIDENVCAPCEFAKKMPPEDPGEEKTPCENCGGTGRAPGYHVCNDCGHGFVA